ncbi:sigma-70 family RNA polymerase sigma factor [Phyllobacterium sp. OV277]|jgi:RNA polymerase sigma-70 factor (ECF subfamily)|uniref:sigma-70 family RNA polymerase sigma factor n=1 Tax=Phyllobacterium sp. OV277 TaxID=1882772 RepID=UPI0008891FBA|nr:sigma-70 family RNA polymerase sigma factor [Phyllobacterium sp. OV277]SDP27424.1 RNA polymerase sigma-70 factor, ECF subfamily [Phyllobacterium sp. OV277]
MKTPKPRFDVVGQLGSLRRYARSLTRNDADAEDLVQDTLLRAYERRGGFRHGKTLRGWLLSILHNRFIDVKRSSATEARTLETAYFLNETSIDAPQEHSVRLGQIREAFFALPEEQRSALHLVAIEGLSYEEAAGTLNIPVGTLMSRISRARATLRSQETEKQPDKSGHLKIVGGRDDRND